jgi:ABC-2 type transport system ATP-binding protein
VIHSELNSPASNNPVSPAVELRQLTARYGDRTALGGIDLEVRAGERVALLGPNGAGKSTLLSILATLRKPTSGVARVAGFDVVKDALEVRRSLGVVFQGPSLDRKLTGEENLQLLGRLYGLSGRELTGRVDEALARVELSGRRRDRVDKLSGGMARRIEIARALLPRPPVLLLDEPTSGLDPRARAELWHYLVQLSDEGMAVIVATHLGDEADRAHRVVILDHGKTVVEGDPAEIKKQVSGEVIEVECDDPAGFVDELLERFGAEGVIVKDLVRIERKEAHEFIPRLVEGFPGRLRSVTLRRPTLEDAFVHFTGHRFDTGEPGS